MITVTESCDYCKKILREKIMPEMDIVWCANKLSFCQGTDCAKKYREEHP